MRSHRYLLNQNWLLILFVSKTEKRGMGEILAENVVYVLVPGACFVCLTAVFESVNILNIKLLTL